MDKASLEGKVVLITGGNAGLGKQSALVLAKKHKPSAIWITARDLAKAESAVAEITASAPNVPVHSLIVDLASRDSVVAAAETISRSVSRLDVLMLNAGIMTCPPGLTRDGYEIQFGTNHVGHALLLKLLTPLLEKTAKSSPKPDVRVIFLSSEAHKYAPSGGIKFDTLKTTATDISTNHRYCQSKLANVLYMREYAKRNPSLTCVALHPGVVKTDLWKSSGSSGNIMVSMFEKLAVPIIGVSVEQGARNQIWAATAKEVKTGEYYTPVGVGGKASTLSKDKELMQRLWNWTEEELRNYQPVSYV